MTTTFRSIYQGAAFRSDLSVNGAGPHASERVTDPEWRRLLNLAVLSTWRIAAQARPDFQVVSSDFTVVSGGSASLTVPADFFDTIDLVYGPDTVQEYSLGPFAWQNRRSPGGWFPANFGGTTSLGGSSCRLMGTQVYIEPALRAGGSYRLWYCPAPKQIRADFTAALATAAALTPFAIAAGSGLSKTLTGASNAALTVDGVAATIGQTILVQNQANAVDNGIYVVTQTGSVGAPYILTRSNLTVTAPGGHNGTMVYVTAGTANTDLFFETTSLTTVVDSTAWTWAEAFVDPIIEQFTEMLEILTAIPAMQRDEDLDPRPLITRAFGADGVSGLAGEIKAYFKQVRVGSGPSKMVDTDARGPQSPWLF